jgi:NhaP-type Na+/H+ or K+/H+ antiporter
LALIIVAYGTAVLIGGNGFIASFVFGIVSGRLMSVREMESLDDFAGTDTIYAAAMLTIFISVLAHGLTAAPLSNRYGKRIANLDKQGAAGPEMMPVPEMPTRVDEVPIREAMSE